MNAVTFATKPAYAHHCAFSVQQRVVDPAAHDAFKVHRIKHYIQLTFTFIVNKIFITSHGFNVMRKII